MFVKIKDTDYEVKYTFNSFKFMKDFDITELNELDHKPFSVIAIVEKLFYGALNHDKRNVFLPVTASDLLEAYAEEGNSIPELLELLMAELEESDFFKNLRK